MRQQMELVALRGSPFAPSFLAEDGRLKLLRKRGTETSSDEGAARKEKEQHEETETMNSTYPPFRPTEVSAVDCARHFSKELVLARVSLLVVTVDHSSKV